MTKKTYSKNATHKLSRLLYEDNVTGRHTMPYNERWHKVRKNSQQTLLFLGNAIAKHNERFYTSDGSAGVHTWPGGSTRPVGAAIPQITNNSYEDKAKADRRAEGWKSGYRWICPIVTIADETETTTQFAQNPDLQISRMSGLGPSIDKFFTFDITTAQQAALVPKIDIYKLEYQMEIDVNGRRTGRINYDIPPIRRPIVFEQAVTQNELDILIESGGNVGSSGIENFSWSLKGVNPAEVDTNIEATLKVYFNNVGVFQKYLDDIATGNLVGTAARPGTFVDLITFAPPAVANEDLPCLETYNPNYFEIEARVGWEVDDSSAGASPSTLTPAGNPNLFTEEQLEYVRNQTLSLYLTLTDHKFDFEEDGSATLDARYRARSTLVGKDFDLLLATVPDQYVDRAVYESTPSGRIEIAQERMRKHERDMEDPDDPTDAQEVGIEKDREKLREALKANYEHIITNLLHNAYEAYVPNRLLLNGITSKSGTPASGATYEGTLSWDDLLEIPMETNTSPTARTPNWWGRNWVRNDRANNEEFQTGIIDKIVADYEDATSAANPILVRRKTKIDTARVLEAVLDKDDDLSDNDYVLGHTRRGVRDPEHLAAERGATEIRAMKGNLTGGRIAQNIDGISIINFFYLGDILEVFFGTVALGSAIASAKFGVTTADFRYKNYLKLLKLLELNSSKDNWALRNGDHRVSMSALRCKQGSLTPEMRQDIYSTMNMANIPINLELFLDWFTQKVVADWRESYYLEHFLNDLFNGMIKPILNDQGVLGTSSTQPTMLNLNLDTITEIPYFQTTQERSPSGPASQITTKIGYDFDRADDPVSGRAYDTVQMTQPDESTTDCSYINFIDQYEELAKKPLGPGGRQIRMPIFPYHQKAPDEALWAAIRARATSTPTVQDIAKNIAFQGSTVKVLGVNTDFDSLDGSYAKNLLKGVKNFIVGLDKGIIKSVSFSRVDQPYLRESRTAVSKNFGVGQLRELYHVDLVLYGNNLLKPGMTIYVEPNSLIFGRPTQENSVARVLGLGGYHLVVDVSSNISKDGWETVVRALHIAVPSYGVDPWEQFEE